MRTSMGVYWTCIVLILGTEAYKGVYYWTNNTSYADLGGGYVGVMSIAMNLLNFLLLLTATVCLTIAAFKDRGSRGRYAGIGFGSLVIVVMAYHFVNLILESSGP